MDGFRLDLRLAIRALLRQPGFSAVVVLTLALGIGATSGVFGAVHAVLLASLPYPEPDRLVLGRRTQDGRVGSWVSGLDYQDYRDQAGSFDAVAAVGGGVFRIPSTGGDRPERIGVQEVSSNLFATLGVTPVVGRHFSTEEGAAAPDAGERSGPRIPPVAMISHGFWQRRFAGEERVVGQTLTVAGQPCTVIGVMPEGFEFRGHADAWVPIRIAPSDVRRFHNYFVVGRLKPGVSLASAQQEIDAISARLEQTYPDSNTGKGLHLDPLHDALVETLRPQLLLMMAAVALMLLIAAGNIANLLLVRGVSRRSELAMRASLGASRARLVRQLVTESVVLGLAGGAAGLALAAALQRALPSLLGLDALGITALRLDARVLAFAAAASLVVGVLVGLVPALRSTSASVFAELKESSRSVTSREGARLRMALVAAQVALSLTLLLGSFLLIRSFARLVGTDLGFDPDNLLTASFLLPAQRYATDEARAQFFSELLAGIRALPGVEAAAMVTQLPIQHPWNDIYVWTPEKPPLDRTTGHALSALNRSVLPGYFDAMRMPLLAGRDIAEGDRAGSSPVLVISRRMARDLFADANPIGRRVVVDMGRREVTFEVVGVVADARINRVSSQPYLTMYNSYLQFPSPNLSVAIRTATDPQAITTALRELVWRRDADIPVEEVGSMRASIRDATRAQQALAATVGAFSLVALLLAGVGLFGVLAYQVRQRRNEIGIRMALGAAPSDVIATVARQGLIVTGAGLVAGAAAGLALTRLMTALLYEVTATDPASFAAAAGCLAVVAVIACLLPALRALSVQPVQALRCE